MLIAIPYYLLATLYQHLIESGWTLWLSLPMLWSLIMGTAFIVMGPLSVTLLASARIREAVASRRL